MGISISNDFLLGLMIGAILILLVQQLTRATSGIWKFLPLLFLLGFVGCAVFMFLSLGR